jgi:hypothetical protein
VFDKTLCAVRGTIPPGTALELVFHPVAYPHFFQDEPETELTLKGAAGSISLRGEQLRRYFEERGGAFVFEYGHP